MNKRAILGTLIVISSFIIMFIGMESKVIGETPCVDGKNRINLEGIMCEDKVELFFGQHGAFLFLGYIPAFFGMWMIFKYDNDVSEVESEQ